MTDVVPFDPEAARLAEALEFAESEGGPFLVVSESAVASWHGINDPTGAVIFGTQPCDYDRACAADAFSMIDVGTTRALTLESPDNSAFVARPDGALIVRWVGADDAQTLLTAAFAAPAEDFKELDAELPHDGGRLRMFDATTSGTMLAERGRDVSIELPAGRYAVSLLVEWSGPVLGADGAPHDTMVQVLRLRRR